MNLKNIIKAFCICSLLSAGCSEKTASNNSMPLTVWKPSGSYQRTVTEYSAHQPVSRTVYDESGALIARGYYTDGCGWLMMYTGN